VLGWLAFTPRVFSHKRGYAAPPDVVSLVHADFAITAAR
jgi:hypothetical protein